MKKVRRKTFLSAEDKDVPSHLLHSDHTTNFIDDGSDDDHNLVPSDDHCKEDEAVSGFGTNIHSCDVSFDMCVGDVDTTDWDVVSDSKSEWDIVSKWDETSIGSFDIVQSFHALSYKDALLKMDAPQRRDFSKSHHVGTTAREVRSRIAIETIPEDEEDEILNSSYFEYDGYKGARGGKPFINSKKAPKASSRVHKAIQRGGRHMKGRIDGRTCRRELRASVR